MHRIRMFFIRILNVFRRSRLDNDLSEQLDAHREMIKADLIEHGMAPSAAEAAARRAMGNDAMVRELSRDAMVHRLIDVCIRDVRYAFRSLLKTPVFTLTVVLTLALGIGANTAIFSIVDRLLLRALPFPNGEQLVMLHENRSRSSRMDVSPANWLDWQQYSRSFESLAAWSNRFPSNLTGAGDPERLDAETVSHEFFPLVGVRPLIGRVFSPEDDRPGASPTAVLSYSLWQRKFAGDPQIIGKQIELNARGVEVIGVMPAGFHFFSNDTDIWQPFALDRNRPWRDLAGRFLPYVVGRVKPSVTPEAAQREMETIAARLSEQYVFNRDTSVRVIPLREVMTGQVRTSLLVLLAAVGVLLLIACSNVANLLLARSAYRRREIAIRASLGAGRGAIVRQLLIESVVLASAGGVVGVFMAWWGVGLLLALVPASLLQVSDVPIDGWVLLYTLGLSVLTGVVVGLAPALPVLHIDVVEHLQTGGRSVTARTRLRQGLIVLQVAMTVVLLCGAGLLVRSLLALTGDATGVDATGVLTMRIELPGARYNPERQAAFFREVTDRLQSLPGVQSASAANDIPVNTLRSAGTSLVIAGQNELPPNERPRTRVRVAMLGYFKTLGIPLLKGRDFSQDDEIAGAPRVFIVNQAFAKKYFGNDDALSASISVNMERPENPYGRIIGIAGDVKEGSLRGNPEPTVFYNHRQFRMFPGMTVFVRTSRGAEIAREATQIVRDLDRNLPVIEVRMLEDAFAESAARERLNAVVSGAFAVCALLLASLGLYGLLAFTVAERTNEIGIRMALGARSLKVLRMIMGHGLRLVAFGAVVGLVIAFAVSRFLESLLFGITSHDLATFIGVPAVLAVVSAFAVLIPALRATRVNPLVALRKD
jgi:putative ABC transport system permease protein